MGKGKVVALIIFVLAIIFLLIFVKSVSFTASPSSINVNEDLIYLHNFTIDNANATNSVIQINITLPSEFSYDGASGTSVATAMFSNSSNVLTWDDISLIPMSGSENFWFNATASNPGVYNFTIDTLDDLGVVNSTNVSITVNDTTQPFIELDYPQNTSYNFVQTQLNYSVADNFVLDSCWYSLDSGFTNSTPDTTCSNFTGLTSNQGSNIWIVYANDTSNNLNSSNVAFFVDSVNTNIAIVYPTNNSNISTNNAEVNYTISDANLESCWYSNDTYAINTTITCGQNITGITWSEGNHNVTIYANDSVGNMNFSTVSFTLDSINPSLNITNPSQNNTNTSDNTLDILFTRSDTNLESCWYSNDTYLVNTTLANCGNITTIVWSDALHNVTIWVNDTFGNLNFSTTSFTVDAIKPTISFESPTDNNDTSFGRNFIRVNISASDANLVNITIRLYNSTRDLLRQNTSSTSPFFINYTSLSEGEYFFNATATDFLNNLNSTSTRNVSLVLPTINLSFPENKTYINNVSIPLNFTYSNADFFWFNLDNGDNSTIIGNTTFNASQGGHRLNLFANNSVGEITRNISFSVNLTKISIGYSSFNGTTKGNSTDLSKVTYEDLQNLSSLILEDTGYGKILFNDIINVTNDEDPSDDIVNISAFINVSSNRIEINSTALPNFNKSATLSFYGLTFSNPRILRNGEVCSIAICVKNDYSSGILSFNVTGFSVYSSEEIPAGESGTTGATGSGGSSGGSGKTISQQCTTNEQCSENEVCINSQCVALFDIKILNFESPAKLGDYFDFTYFVKGMANINDDIVIKFWIEKNGEIVSSGSDTIFLGSLEEKTETAQIFLPSVVETGVYQFKISVSREDYSAEASRTIEIVVDEEKGIVTITSVRGGLNKNIIY